MINIIIVAFFSFFSLWNMGEEVDFGEILKKADFHRGGQVSGVAWDLDVKNIEQGELKNEITFLVEASSTEKRQFVLVSFLQPRKYKGQKLLIRDNNMWFAKPGLRRPVPISGRQRLSGTASNADVAAANYFKDYFIVSGTEGEINDQACWVLELEARNNLVSYPRIKYWISKDKNFGLRAEYYGKSDKLIKAATFQYDNKVRYKKETHSYISEVTIFDKINTEDKTILNISDVRFTDFNNSKFQKNRILD